MKVVMVECEGDPHSRPLWGPGTEDERPRTLAEVTRAFSYSGIEYNAENSPDHRRAQGVPEPCRSIHAARGTRVPVLR
jgi:hypothetical protein